MRLKYIDETRILFFEKTKQNELMSKKHKKIYGALNYIKHILILVPTVTGYVPIYVFASLVGIRVGIMSSAVRLKIYVINCKKSISQ